MARKKITANLNGGDAVTAMGDLQFQIYDASDNSIIATANYAAIGSVNNNGTDGGDINYTLNATYDPGSGLLGQIILDGVDLGAVVPDNVKIRCKDESGNESILSDAFSVSDILFQDSFGGITIDTDKWEIALDTGVTFTQNEKLEINQANTDEKLFAWIYSCGNEDGSKAVSTGAIGAIFDVNFTSAADSIGYWIIKMSNGLTGTDTWSIGMERNGQVNTECDFTIHNAGVKIVDNQIAVDLTTNPTLKFILVGTTAYIYIWSGSWVLWASSALYGTDPLGTGFMIEIGARADTTANVIEIDNLFIISEDITTQYPE